MALQLLVNPVNFNNAKDLISLGIDRLLVGLADVSVHCGCVLSINQIKELVKTKKRTKIFININKYFVEHELSELTKILLEINKINIDGIFFSDFAIPQILYEHKITAYLVYNPETLVTNYGQFDFYLKNNINEVCLARELNKNEIENICKHKNNMSTQMQICGYPFIMHSKWKMLSTFANANKLKSKLLNKKLFIKENNRKYPMIIYEDKNDTYIYGAYETDLIPYIWELSDVGIDVARIDGFLQTEQWVIKKVKSCLGVMQNQDKKYKNHSLLTNTFYENKKNNFIYLKEGDYE